MPTIHEDPAAALGCEHNRTFGCSVEVVNDDPAPQPLTRDELRDFFWDAILGSLDMDWTADDGAAAIMSEVDKLGATDALCAALSKWGVA